MADRNEPAIRLHGGEGTFLVAYGFGDWFFRVRGWGVSFHRLLDNGWRCFSCRNGLGDHRRHLIIWRGWHLMLLTPRHAS